MFPVGVGAHARASVACPKFIPAYVVVLDTRHRWVNWPAAKRGGEPLERKPLRVTRVESRESSAAPTEGEGGRGFPTS